MLSSVTLRWIEMFANSVGGLNFRPFCYRFSHNTIIVHPCWLCPSLRIPVFNFHCFMPGISYLIGMRTQSSRELTHFAWTLLIGGATSDAQVVICIIYDYFTNLSRHCTTRAPLKRTLEAASFKALMWSITWTALSPVTIACEITRLFMFSEMQNEHEGRIVHCYFHVRQSMKSCQYPQHRFLLFISASCCQLLC